MDEANQQERDFSLLECRDGDRHQCKVGGRVRSVQRAGALGGTTGLQTWALESSKRTTSGKEHAVVIILFDWSGPGDEGPEEISLTPQPLPPGIV
jgi:hypothetical protein